MMNRVTTKRKIGGDFPVIFKMELVLGKIRGDFPLMQRKTPYIRVFRANRRNFSVYLGLF